MTVRTAQEPDVFTVFCDVCEWWVEFPRGDSVLSSNTALVDSLHAHLDHECNVNER